MLNDSTIKAVRKLKDSTGQYLWQPSLTAGTPDTLLGRPVKTSAYMPVIAAGAKPIAFGDFSYYWIADRQGRSFKRLNELYAANGQVGFLGSQRVDGKLVLSEEVKVMVTLQEMKNYLRVDDDDDDALIETIIASAERQCMDILRTDSEEELASVQNGKTAVMFTAAYLYEHREEADHHALNLTLRALLFGSRKEAF